MGAQVRIDLYVDPCCPFAWIAYQWLAEVQQHRALELGLHLMSLPMLNEHRSISPGYRRLLAHTGARRGRRPPPSSSMAPNTLAALYEAMARRILAGADQSVRTSSP